MSRALAPSSAWLQFVLLVSCLAVHSSAALGQDPTSDWLGRVGLDRLRLHSLLHRLDSRSISEEERARTADQLLDIYVRLLSVETDEDFRSELGLLSEKILEEIGSERGDPIRFELAAAEWKSLLNRLHTEIILGRVSVSEADRLLGMVDALSKQTAQLNKRAKSNLTSVRKQLTNAQGSRIETLTQKYNDLEDLLRQIRFLNGWVHAYLGWLAAEPTYSNAAQRMFALLLSSDESSFVLPNDEDISVQRRREDWFSESIIGMAIARAPDASSATVGAWLDLLSVPNVSDSVRSAVPFYRMALLLRSDDSDRYGKARRVYDRIDFDEVASPTELLLLGAVHALADASADPEASELARSLLRMLAERGEIDRLKELSRGFSLEFLPGDQSLFHFMRGSSHVLNYQALSEQGDQEQARESARLAIADLDLGITLESEESDRSLLKQMLFLRGNTNQFLERPLEASIDFEEASSLAQGLESGDLLWRSIVALSPDALGVANDPATLQRRYQLIERLLENHSSHPRSQAARLIQIEHDQLLRESTPEDAERLLQPTSDPAVGGLAIRKAASILYGNWLKAVPDDRNELARRFIAVVQQPEILPANGAFDSRDLGLLVGLLRLSLQSDPPDPAIAQRVLDAFDLAADNGRFTPGNRALEIESLRLESMLTRPFPDFQELNVRLEGLRSHPSDPHVRRAALLLIRSARESLRRRDEGLWGDNEQSAVESIRMGVPLVVGSPLSQERLANDTTWQLVSTWARAEHDLYEAVGDETALEAAFTLYQQLAEAKPLQKKAIAGLARTASASNRNDLAQQAWQTLMNSATPGSLEFFEAQCFFLESLAKLDEDRVRSILDQHVVMYPSYGPDPWGPRLQELHERIRRVTGGVR